MKDVLIPLGLLFFIGFFVYALVHTSRKQRKAKSRAFEDFAIKNGLRYQEEDDGKAQEFARDFDGIGRFKSPSLGKVIPKDVVSGTLNASQVIFFRHSTRYSEGWAMEWFVAGLTRVEPIAERCAIQFCKGWSDKSTMHLQDAIVKEQSIGSFNIVVRAATPSCAGKLLDDRVLTQLTAFAGELSFRPEIQVRGNRIIGYLADRNAMFEGVETLSGLFELTRKVASI